MKPNEKSVWMPSRSWVTFVAAVAVPAPDPVAVLVRTEYAATSVMLEYATQLLVLVYDKFHVCVPADVTVLYCVTTCIEVRVEPVLAFAEYADDHEPRVVSVSEVTEPLPSIPATINTVSSADIELVVTTTMLELDNEKLPDVPLDGFLPVEQTIL
jgi:hypothetical protein